MLDSQISPPLNVNNILETGWFSANSPIPADGATLAQNVQRSPLLSTRQLDATVETINLQLGTEGDDTFSGTDGCDLFLGQAGNDTLAGRGGQDILVSGPGDDWLNGGTDNDLLLGIQGNNTLVGGSGDDRLLGGEGKDRLVGQSGDDTLWSGGGNDDLDGGPGLDTLNGGSGDDVLIDPDGGVLTGGAGRDEFRLGDGRLPDTPKIAIFPPVPDFTITDFAVGDDQLTLNFGIAFDDLTFLDTDNGTIVNAQSREGLVLLEGIDSEELTEDSFYFGDADLQASFQATLDQILTESGFPGISVSVISPDGTIWTSAQGVADLEVQTPLRPDDRFVIGSVTKLFTATTVLQLAEEGKLSLDDPMSHWLPEIAKRIPNGEHITVRQLLSHTSGVRNDDDDLAAAYLANPDIAQQEWTASDFLALIYDKEPMGEPGQFGYSNPNYTLLGEIIEAATDSALEQQFQTRIFEPLGLTDTFYAYPEDIPGGYVKSYYDESGDGNFEDILSQVHPSLSVKKAAGGIVSTPTDLARFAQALFSAELLSPTSLTEMVSDRNPFLGSFEYGLGVMYDDIPKVGRVLGHEGAQSVFGWRASMYHLPDFNLTIAITSNGFSESTDPVSSLWADIILNTIKQTAEASMLSSGV
ncbi:serine hydrolase [Nodosilinea sp. LEGE 07088]|uniref:serine hydrolase n=1 Tax=Nodosilinea sp. LEGE 07088 TaxID=2777968 RepID=UPI0018818212|nr:serine hydrolase [Nodosilinea sp. LEGE 07088]MBE9141328.1 serine hydrolase [Nodosilinea sp. LEGE 07088]